jgi:hypothetical protein
MKPDLFSNFFKPERARARSMKPEPDPNPKKLGPTHLYLWLRLYWLDLMPD